MVSAGSGVLKRVFVFQARAHGLFWGEREGRGAKPLVDNRFYKPHRPRPVPETPHSVSPLALPGQPQALGLHIWCSHLDLAQRVRFSRHSPQRWPLYW
jgi:hypothetical protein